MNAVVARSSRPRPGLYLILGLLAAYAVAVLALMWWWDSEPAHFDVAAAAKQRADARSQPVVVGSATTAALVGAAGHMLDKRGGYRNDRFPPGHDGQPAELIRRADRDARPHACAAQRIQPFADAVGRGQTSWRRLLSSSPNDRWLLPSSESQYRKAIARVDGYAQRLADDDPVDAQFHARADNLADYLQVVSTRLGSLSQRLSASVGQVRIDTDLANDPTAQQSRPGESPRMVKTPWLKIDDNFYGRLHWRCAPAPRGDPSTLRRSSPTRTPWSASPGHPRTRGSVTARQPDRGTAHRSAFANHSGAGQLRVACQRGGDRARVNCCAAAAG